MRVKIENRKIVGINDVNQKLYEQFLSINSDNGYEFEITFASTRKLVNDKQLKLYNFIVLTIMEYTGESFDKIDRKFRELLPERIHLNDNNEVETYRLKMEAMENFEFEIFINKILDYIEEFFDIKMQVQDKNGILKISK